MTLGDRTITDFCAKMIVIIDILADIGALVPEKTLTTHLLNDFTSRFDNISTLIHHQSLLPILLYLIT